MNSEANEATPTTSPEDDASLFTFELAGGTLLLLRFLGERSGFPAGGFLLLPFFSGRSCFSGG